MLGAIELESDGLVDGYGNGFGVGVAVVARMNRKGFRFHPSPIFNAVFVFFFLLTFVPFPYFAAVTTSVTGTEERPWASDFAITCVICRAVKPPPKANRMSGP